ncbi:branched-chain amino acid ABC transporter permease [Peterkaempfera bronchialis]|uniref:Branched-chain amino acid ABC transporter permease n=1 Tax=Peterkaempfera bronchialis TaxID=2126346 RepID=A0A345T3M8_9ACTN|nr:branched-chain amino acid ABC transporter permease [Peterkaempfera bronchialis]AXI80583.1 branched-chain amino acid ABC transporter permease [Peterkaempfera bronchialis]
MSTLLQALVSAVVMGSVYALMTVGMTLIYGSLRILNMVQGVMTMIGGFVAWWALDRLGVNPWLGLVLAALLTFGLGVAVQQIGVRPLIGRRGIDFEMAAFITTFGLATILQNVVQLWFGPRQLNFPALVDGQFTLLSGVTVTWQQVVMTVVAVGLLLGLHTFMVRSRYGMSINAVAQNLHAAQLMGVPVRRVHVITMGIASALAGVAGVMLAPIYFVSSNAGDQPLLLAMIVAILGGLGSVRGTIWAAYVIGLIQSVVSVYWSVTWSLPMLFAVIVVVLVVRPFGLDGKPQEARL